MSHEDLFAKCATDGGYFGEFRHSGDAYFTQPVLESLPGRRMRFAGRECVMWSINNYLGLAESPEVKAAALEALERWGTSAPMGARMMSGNTEEHIALEGELSRFAGKESAIVFNYGYMGVAGTVGALVGPDDVIVVDKLDHASIIDAAFGAAQNRRNVRVFRHNDMESLEHLLRDVNKTRKKGVLVITEGVYGMTGDLAKLDDICELKDKYDARLMIDDAHGFGVMGPTGRGTSEHFGVQDKVDIYFGTFAKAFAAIGGVSASTKDVVEWIRYNARSQVFAKALPMVYVKSLQKTLELVIDGKQRRDRLFDVARRLSSGLRDLGFRVGKVESPIVPVFTPGGGDPRVAMDWIRFLRDNGVFVTGVMYPVIPKNYVEFRMVPSASHEDEDIELTLRAFRKLRDEKAIDLSIDWSGIDKLYGAEAEGAVP
jgi:glycine C-acetyltransferase